MKRFMYATASVIVLFSIVAFVILQQSKFGKLPSGDRLERIKKSLNYKHGSFQNQSITPVMTEGVSYFSLGKKFFFYKKCNSFLFIKKEFLTKRKITNT